MKLEHLDRKIIQRLSSRMPLVKQPFNKIARDLDMSKDNLLKKLRGYKRQGLLKGIRPHLNYSLLGYKYNALVAWRIKEYNPRSFSVILKKIKNVSHSFIRKEHKAFSYNLYTMVHAKTERELYKTINTLKNILQLKEYCLLPTIKELKRESSYYHG
jgi:DNA-binding Lrp family transcriptional regulator